jgi:hypothetical protein
MTLLFLAVGIAPSTFLGSPCRPRFYCARVCKATSAAPPAQRDVSAGLRRCKSPLCQRNIKSIFIAMHLGIRSFAALCLIATASASRALPTPPVYELEHPKVSGTATGYFHLERLGQRWWFIAPDGSGFFPRAVALLDFSSSGAAGTGFRAYDAVALAPAGSSAYRMVTDEAEDSDSSDVLMPGRSYTVRDPGDTILIGSSRFQPEFTKFQMSMLGGGGTIVWYYFQTRARDAPRHLAGFLSTVTANHIRPTLRIPLTPLLSTWPQMPTSRGWSTPTASRQRFRRQLLSYTERRAPPAIGTTRCRGTCEATKSVRFRQARSFAMATPSSTRSTTT